ncbi:hypothetical protein MLT69_016540, partial [Escherichia coli]|nr:hypothetical protein [Escherichia coli]
LPENIVGQSLSVGFRPLPQTTPARPFDDYVIAASPVYIEATEDDILAGASKLNNHIAQLTVVTSGEYSGLLESYLIRSESRMMRQLSSNMVCLNIKLAQYIIGSRRYS